MCKKSLIKFILISSILASFSYGCKSQQKIHVIHNTTVVTNNVPMQSFNDQNYIWEAWTISTNEVKTINK